MGRSMTFKKNTRPMTEQKFNQEKARLEREITEAHNEWVKNQKNDITASATELAYCLFLVAISNVYGFRKKRLLRILDEIGRLSDCVTSGDLTWWDIRDEAERLGFVPANEGGYLDDDSER